MNGNLIHNWSYKVGSRGSILAQRQTHLVLQALKNTFSNNNRLAETETIWFKTSGDKIPDRPLADIGGKALFCKEVQEALLDKKIDFAVHSLKDLEHTSPPGLTVVAVLEREDPYDVLITPLISNSYSLLSLKPGGRVGTCAPRRAAQLLHIRPDLQIMPLRGNVPTRLQKLENEGLDAIVVALAGLKRLGIWEEGYTTLKGYPHLNVEILSFEDMLPAAGQGAIAVECREDDHDMSTLLKGINHLETYTCIQAERALLKELGGNCHTAIAALATITTQGNFELTAAYFPDYPTQKKGRRLLVCQSGARSQATSLGQTAATILKNKRHLTKER